MTVLCNMACLFCQSVTRSHGILPSFVLVRSPKHIGVTTSKICKQRNIIIIICVSATLKEMINQDDKYLVSLSSKTYVFEDKLTKY